MDESAGIICRERQIALSLKGPSESCVFGAHFSLSAVFLIIILLKMKTAWW